MLVSHHAMKRYRQRFNSRGNVFDILRHIKEGRLATDIERQAIHMTRPRPSRRQDSPDIYIDGNIAFVVVEEQILTCYDCTYLYSLPSFEKSKVKEPVVEAPVEKIEEPVVVLEAPPAEVPKPKNVYKPIDKETRRLKALYRQYVSGKSVYYIVGEEPKEISMGIAKGDIYVVLDFKEGRRPLSEFSSSDFCVMEFDSVL